MEAEENKERQIVVYKPPVISTDEEAVVCTEIVPVPVPEREGEGEGEGVVVLPAVGAYTVQCAVCYKWRLIPSKAKYQEIREHIMEQPFSCEVAREWRSHGISCDDPAGDVEPDGCTLWAIDKPGIAQPPPGWDRELRIRGPGGSNFSDVYYTSPTGKKLRSIVDVKKYLMKHPEFVGQGAALSRFSFKQAKPLQENYVRRKRSAPRKALPGETSKDNPTLLQLGGPDIFASHVTVQRKKRSRPSAKHIPVIDLENNEAHEVNTESPFGPPNSLMT